MTSPTLRPWGTTHTRTTESWSGGAANWPRAVPRMVSPRGGGAEEDTTPVPGMTVVVVLLA